MTTLCDMPHTSTPDTPSLSVAEVAAMYQVNPETVRRWIRADKLRGCRTPGGKDYRIMREDLRAAGLPAPLEAAS